VDSRRKGGSDEEKAFTPDKIIGNRGRPRPNLARPNYWICQPEAGGSQTDVLPMGKEYGGMQTEQAKKNIVHGE